MKNFTKPGFLLTGLVLLMSISAFSQTGVLNPNDPIVVYNPSNPPATPPYGTLVKWVKTNRVGYNTDSYKSYFYKGVQFRLKFPKTYQHGVDDGKKYPLLLFFHGRGEKGTIYDNEYQLYHGGQKHRDAVDQGKFDGFLFYPQTTEQDGTFTSLQTQIIAELITNYFVPQIKVDINRILVDGLSGGGNSTWAFAIQYPTLVAGITPISSPIGIQGPTNALNNLKYTPIWQFQGGKDEAPSPFETQMIVNAYNNAGANYKMTLYPNLGHGCWNQAWSEADYFPYNVRAYKSNPWPVGGRTEFCPGDPINVTIGVTPGLSGYEWRKDGALIPGATGNTITATSIGVYDCRIRRGSEWSEWSPIPVEIKIKLPTVTPPISLDGLVSNVIPVPDGNNGVMLKVPSGYVSYEWQKVGSGAILGTDSTFYATTPGEYRARVTELYGCSSDFSAPFTVVNANGSNKPEPATNLTATTLSKTSLRLDWTDNPAPAHNETHYEIYQTAQLEIPYTLIAVTGANVNTYTVEDLAANTKYYYIVRAVNGTGASAVSNQASTTTDRDANAPSTPDNLRITKTTKTSVSLAWSAATDDVGIKAYDVFFNGTKLATTGDTVVTVYNLLPVTYYTIIVKSRDLSDNHSAPSNQLTAYTVTTGYNYKHYLGTWSQLPDFSQLTPVTTGNTPTVTLNPRVQDNNIGFLWEGYINVPVDGTYTFRTNSDDGSKLYIGALNQKTSAYDYNATALVDNDGIHTSRNREGSINLVAGNYPIAIAYFNRSNGGRSISVTLRTPLSGTSYPAIPESWLYEIPAGAQAAPERPSKVMAGAISQNAIALNWSDNSSNETAFEIYRSLNPYDQYTLIASVGANTTQYTDTDLTATTRYYYRVKAVNQYGESDQGYAYAEAIYGFNNNFFDESGNDRTLTPSGNPIVDAVEKREGGQSVRVGASTNQSFLIPTGDGFLKNPYSEKTIAFWMKAASTTGNQVVFDLGGSDDGLAMKLDANTLLAGVASNNVRKNFAVPYNSLDWNHIALVYKGSSLKLYINGVEAGAMNNNLGFTTITTTSNNSRIGLNESSNAFNNNGVRYNGWLDHFSIYANALSQDEIAAHMNNSLQFSHATTLAVPAELAAPHGVVATGIATKKVVVAWQHTASSTDTTNHDNTVLNIEGESYTTQTGVGLETCSEGGQNVRSIDANDWMDYTVNIPFTGTYTLNMRLSATSTQTDQVQLRKMDGTPLATLTAPRTTTSQTWTTITATGINLTAGTQVLRVYALKNAWNLNWFELTTPGFTSIDTTTVTPTAYTVYRSTQQAEGYAAIATVPAASQTYTDSAVNANTIYYYKVKANNADGESAFSGDDSAKTGNTNPTIAAISNRNMRYGTTLDIAVEAADADEDALTISFNNLPAFASFDAGTIHLAPLQANTGVYAIKVYAADAHGGKDSTGFTLTVNDNFNPVITSAGDIQVTEKQSKTFKLTVADQNAGDVINWSFKGLPAFAQYVIDADSVVVTLTPGFGDNGAHTITALVDDGKGGVDSTEFNIQVNDVNPHKTIYVNFSDGTYTVPGNWNNTAKVPVANDQFNNLIDSAGTGTGINMTLVTTWTGINNGGVNTGSNSGVYPDAALVSSYYTSAVQTVRLNGLPKGKYNFAFLGSRANPMAGVGVTSQYTIGSTSVTLNAANNAQNVARINNVEPDANGIVNITVQKAAGSTFGYLNVLEILAIYDDSTAPAKPRNLAAQLNGQEATLTWVDAAYNESGYGVYKATNAAGPYTLLNAPANVANLQEYTDGNLTGGTTYYYFVRVTNGYGVTYSDTITVATPNLAPVITDIPNQLIHTNEAKNIAVTATDTPGDQIALSASGLPDFASFTDNGNGSGTLHITATTQKGLFGPVTITAADGAQLEASKQFTIKVISGDTSIAYVNFNATDPAPAPWNNFTSAPNANVQLSNLTDEGDQPTGITVTLVDKWTAANNLGVVTGNNSGIYPDDVIKTFYYESTSTPKRIRLSGLSSTKRYNLVFFASRADYTSALITRYAVGTQSVDLDANNNATKTVKLTGVAPDANGQILVTATRIAGPVGYIGAMEIHSYESDGSPSAPIATALALSKSRIQLNWSPSGQDATAYRIYRSTEPDGTYSLIEEVPSNTLSYTDEGLNTGTAYYYKMVTVTSTSQSAYGAIVAARTMQYNININFNDGSSGAPNQPVWNNTAALIGEGFTLSNLLNDEYTNTGINMTVSAPFSGFNTVGSTTGNNSGVVPDNVMKSFYYLNFADTAKLTISGLTPAMTYNFVFFGSRGNPNVGVNVTSGYRIGNETVTLNAGNNTMNTVQINGVRPDESGTVEISIFATGSGGFGYLNSLHIQGTSAVDPFTNESNAAARQIITAAKTGNSEVIAENAATTSRITNSEAAIVADAYPNPFVSDVTVRVKLDKPTPKLSIAVMDIGGKMILRREFSNVSSGLWQQKIGLNGSRLSKGVYLIRVDAGNGKPVLIKMVK